MTPEQIKELDAIHSRQLEREQRAKKEMYLAMSKEDIKKYQNDKKRILWQRKST